MLRLTFNMLLFIHTTFSICSTYIYMYIDHFYNTMSACDKLINVSLCQSYYILQTIPIYSLAHSLFPTTNGVSGIAEGTGTK